MYTANVKLKAGWIWETGLPTPVTAGVPTPNYGATSEVNLVMRWKAASQKVDGLWRDFTIVTNTRL